jgi:hypothetical protein
MGRRTPYLEKVVTANLSKISTVEDMLAAAERQCLADEDAHSRRRDRDRLRRAGEDADLVRCFAAQIETLFPGCPARRAQTIARHSAARGSGRVGHTAAGQAVRAEAVQIASIRHEDTDYDELLMAGVDHAEARERVHSDVDRTLEAWRADTAVRG